MNAFKILSASTMALFTLLVVTATAFGVSLPDMHVLSGEAYSVTAEGKLKGVEVAILLAALGKLTAEEVRAKLVVESLDALGKAEFDFINVKESKGKQTCHTKGDAEGVVLLIGEFHLVLTVSATTGELAALILFTELTIECVKEIGAGIKVFVRGPMLVKVIAPLNKDFTSFEVTVLCKEKDIQLPSSYFTDEGKELTKILLLADFGAGKENACELVKEPIKLEIQQKKMIEILMA